jgi:6-phosphofructokinase 1
MMVLSIHPHCQAKSKSGEYGVEFTRRILETEGAGVFTAREVILGNMQQGGDPSPYDRINATRFGIQAVHSLEEVPLSSGTLCTFLRPALPLLPLPMW